MAIILNGQHHTAPNEQRHPHDHIPRGMGIPRQLRGLCEE